MVVILSRYTGICLSSLMQVC